LTVAERQGVQIDNCPQCRGVWLDRGELDKIIERYDAYAVHYMEEGDRRRNTPRRDFDDDEADAYDREHQRSGQQRRKSFWQELFD
jgi:hypothetical protein